MRNVLIWNRGLSVSLLVAVLAHCAGLALLAQTPTPIINLVPQVSCSSVNPAGNTATGCSYTTLSMYDSVSGESFTLPAGTLTQEVSTPNTVSVNQTLPWISLPPSASVELSGLTALPPSNTTIKLRVIAQTNPGANQTSILGMRSPDSNFSYSLFFIGQNGSDWSFARYYNATEVGEEGGEGYMLTPWDVTDLYYQQTNIAETLYYTFLPNGRLRVDLFIPYLSGSTLQYVWNEAIEDGGWPMINRKGITANQPTLPFFSSNDLYLGGTTDLYAAFSSGPSPNASPIELVNVVAYSAALDTTTMLNDFLQDEAPGASAPPSGILPCNTGMYLSQSQVTTPCGSTTAQFSPVPAPPATITGLGTGAGYAPTSLGLSLQPSGQAINVSWNPPLANDVSPTGYLLVWSGNGTSNYTTVATSQTSDTLEADSVVLPNSQVNVSVSLGAQSSGVPWAANASATGTILTGPGAVTSLVLKAATAKGKVTATWTAPNPNNPPSGYTVQLYRINDGDVLKATETETSPSFTYTGLASSAKFYITVTPAGNASGVAPITTTSKTVTTN